MAKNERKNQLTLAHTTNLPEIWLYINASLEPLLAVNNFDVLAEYKFPFCSGSKFYV